MKLTEILMLLEGMREVIILYHSHAPKFILFEITVSTNVLKKNKKSFDESHFMMTGSFLSITHS